MGLCWRGALKGVVRDEFEIYNVAHQPLNVCSHLNYGHYKLYAKLINRTLSLGK